MKWYGNGNDPWKRHKRSPRRRRRRGRQLPDVPVWSGWGRKPIWLAVIALVLAPALLLALNFGSKASAGLDAVGPIDPNNGYPLWYRDADGLTLAHCLDQGGLCLTEEPDPGSPISFPDNFGPEAFYWAAEADMETPDGVTALLVLALESAFGGEEEIVDGNQIVFGRVRIRVTGLIPGETYVVTHPFGEDTFEATSEFRNINFSEDIGGLPGDFATALTSRVGPFLTAVAPAPPAGFVGNPNIGQTVTGSPTGNNLFRIEGPNIGGPGVNVIETDLFAVMGKIFDGVVADAPPLGDGDGDGVLNADDACPGTAAGAAVDANGCSAAQVDSDGDGVCNAGVSSSFCAGSDACPGTAPGATIDANGCSAAQVDSDGDGVCNAGASSSFCVGSDACPGTAPGAIDVDVNGCSADQVAGGADCTGLAVVGPIDPENGYPLWYQDCAGLALAHCLDQNGLCLTEEPDPNSPISFPDNFGPEAFYWAAEADMAGPNGETALLVLALESAFGGEEEIVDGNQIVFGRVRIRVTGLIPGETYVVTHPFGVDEFVATSEFRNINFSEDIGGLPGDFQTALTSRVGPFLVWDPAELPAPPAGFVGNPNIGHTVIGSPNCTNFFRIEGPNIGGLGVHVIETNLFAVMGKIFSGDMPTGGCVLSSEHLGARGTTQTGAPGTTEGDAPTTTESGAPGTTESGAPATTESGAPATTESGAPATTEHTAALSGESETLPVPANQSTAADTDVSTRQAERQADVAPAAGALPQAGATDSSGVMAIAEDIAVAAAAAVAALAIAMGTWFGWYTRRRPRRPGGGLN